MHGSKIQSKEACLQQSNRLSPEAQQIASVMEHCISQVRIAAALPGIQLDTPSSVVNTELTELLNKHQELVGALETLEGPKHEAQKEKEEETAEEKRSLRTHLGKDIKNSVRDVLRHFRTHPDTTFGLETELNMGIGENEEILITSLEMFRSHMLEKLQASLDDQPQLPTRSPLNSDLKQTLVQEEKQYAATAPSEQVNDAQGGVASPLTDAREQSQPQPRTHSTKQSRMQQEIDHMNAQLYNLILENSLKETVLQEKNEQVELEIKYLLKTFDNEMEETQNKLESMEQIYEKEQEEVRRLDKLCAALEPQYNQIQEKRRLAEEKKQEEMKDLELKTKAAIYAQAWWRGHSTRMALKNKVKSKKAKKGKKTKGTK